MRRYSRISFDDPIDVSTFPKIMGSHKNGQIPFAVALWVIAIGAWLGSLLNGVPFCKITKYSIKDNLVGFG